MATLTGAYDVYGLPVAATSRALARCVEIAALAALLAVNWVSAGAHPSQIFSYTSIALFIWTLVIVARITPAGAILLLPLIVTRIATMSSLLAIEAGAYMPEVSRTGSAGDASASFAAFTAVFFLAFACVFRMAERPALVFARSPLLDKVVALLAWPAVAVCIAWGAVAVFHGLQTGFPLLQEVDRFLYRREYSNYWVLALLDNKFLLSAVLGTITFRQTATPLLRSVAALTLIALTGLYFLFGDKFFTILTEVSFFLMPFLLQRQGSLVRTLLLGFPLALALLAAAMGATLYIYSDYGRLPADRTLKLLGERIAGQGELWFIATRDFKQPISYDRALVSRYTRGLDAQDPGKASFSNGVETYYFIEHYASPEMLKNFRRSGGFVQLTVGYEAMALVMFGYWGVAAAMMVAGVLAALSALFLLRTLAYGLPVTLFFSVWTYLQTYFVVQQAALWPVAAPGQWKRFLLFAVIELLILALNRGQIMRLTEAARVHGFRAWQHSQDLLTGAGNAGGRSA